MPKSTVTRHVVTIDPTMQYSRRLHYREKEGGWTIYKTIYWGIFVFVLGIILVTFVPSTISTTAFIGWALILFAMFLIIYGLTSSLHFKLMRRYG